MVIIRLPFEKSEKECFSYGILWRNVTVFKQKQYDKTIILTGLDVTVEVFPLLVAAVDLSNHLALGISEHNSWDVTAIRFEFRASWVLIVLEIGM